MGFACQSTRPLPQSGIGDDVISVPACEMISGELWDHSFALTALSTEPRWGLVSMSRIHFRFPTMTANEKISRHRTCLDALFSLLRDRRDQFP